jgi:molybdate transport system ATP-binding protein
LERPVTPFLSVAIKARLGGFNLDVAFEGPAGITVLFGPSGAGKSATLAAIAGALRPDGGCIRLGDAVLYHKSARINLKPEGRGVGWVFQDARLFPHLDVRANLRYGLKRSRAQAETIRFEDVVSVLGLDRLLARRPRDLSGGEAQRVALGRALLSQPRLLLMDEPLSALDAARKADILAFIERVRDVFAIPTLYVTHSLAETVQLADRLVVLNDGRVMAEGPPADVLSRPDLPLLAARADAASVIEGVIAEHQSDRRLTLVRAGGAVWTCPLLDKAVEAPVRLVVLARDVMLAIEEPTGLSARNSLPGEIVSLTPRGDDAVLAVLAVGGRRILCTLTPDAVESLALRPGLSVWAVVKSVAIEGAGRDGLLPLFDG